MYPKVEGQNRFIVGYVVQEMVCDMKVIIID